MKPLLRHCPLPLLVTLALSTPAVAQSLAAQAGADVLARRCASSGGSPAAQPGLVRPIQIGGRRASALDPLQLTCKGAQPVDCGAFGCKLSIYFDGVAPVFEAYVKAWRARGGKLEIMRVGAYCTGAGESCSETYRASADGLELSARGEAKFDRDRAPKSLARTAGGDPARAKSQEARDAGSAGRQQERRTGAARPSTHGRFDAQNAQDARAGETKPPVAPLAPGAVAERRRRLDAAPYVP